MVNEGHVSIACKNSRCYPVLTEICRHGFDRLYHSHITLNVGSCTSRRGSEVCKDTITGSAHTSRERDGRPRGGRMGFTDLKC